MWWVGGCRVWEAKYCFGKCGFAHAGRLCVVLDILGSRRPVRNREAGIRWAGQGRRRGRASKVTRCVQGWIYRKLGGWELGAGQARKGKCVLKQDVWGVSAQLHTAREQKRWPQRRSYQGSVCPYIPLGWGVGDGERRRSDGETMEVVIDRQQTRGRGRMANLQCRQGGEKSNRTGGSAGQRRDAQTLRE